jgi:hypothetical protein
MLIDRLKWLLVFIELFRYSGGFEGALTEPRGKMTYQQVSFQAGRKNETTEYQDTVWFMPEKY